MLSITRFSFKCIIYFDITQINFVICDFLDLNMLSWIFGKHERITCFAEFQPTDAMVLILCELLNSVIFTILLVLLTKVCLQNMMSWSHLNPDQSVAGERRSGDITSHFADRLLIIGHILLDYILYAPGPNFNHFFFSFADLH